MLATSQHSSKDDRGSHFPGSPKAVYKNHQWSGNRSEAAVASSRTGVRGGDDDSWRSGDALTASVGTTAKPNSQQASLRDFPLPPNARPPKPRTLPPGRTAASLPPLPPLPALLPVHSAPPVTNQTSRGARSLSHDAAGSASSTKRPSVTITKPLSNSKKTPPAVRDNSNRKDARSYSISASRPAITQRLRNRSQSQSHAAASPIAVEQHPRDPSTSSKSQPLPVRSKRSGVTGGFLLGLGGYDSSEYKNYSEPGPATPNSVDAEMAPGVRLMGKQKNVSGSGSSLIFGPPRTMTSTSLNTMASNSTSSTGLSNLTGSTLNPTTESLASSGGRLRAGSLSTAGTGGTPTASSPLNPFPSNNIPAKAPVFKHEGGRRWLRDPTLPYPLPVDLEELHRQSLRLIMMMRLFGAPFLNKQFLSKVAPDSCEQDSPRRKSVSTDLKHTQGASKAASKQSAQREKRQLRVLEVGCGSGLWSSACHDYLSSKGFSSVHFTGMDVAPLAPDLRKQGVNWRFVQWDARRLPWPFDDSEFDMIFTKDCGFMVSSVATSGSSPMPESTRILRPGGVIEIWESDHVFRTLLPSPKLPPGTQAEDARQAEAAGAHVINASTPFAPAQNKFLSDLNAWMTAALNERDLPPTPCGLIEWAVRADPETFTNVGTCRIALPFDETRWERQVGRPLSDAQKGLRRTALLTTLQLIAALEPLLKVTSGKRQDEWNRWWAAGLRDLLEDKGAAGGECLELGAFWATRA